MASLKELLKESTKDMLSEDNLEKIQKLFEESVNEKVEKKLDEKKQVYVESALAKMDEDHAEKLEKILEDIDQDHTDKIKRVVEALENKHTGMLQNLVKKYQVGVKNEISTFKEDMLTKLDKFFDLVVENAVPQEDIQKAVENTHYKKLFEHVSKLLNLGEVTKNDVVREGLLDAKKQIDTLREQVKSLKGEKQKLIKENMQNETKKLLSEKCEGLTRQKKEYIFKVLGNKDVEFINENFDLTLNLYDENEDSNLEELRKSAKSKVIEENVDRVEEVVEETDDFDGDPIMESYLDGLGRDTM
jgi:hypothetical protein